MEREYIEKTAITALIDELSQLHSLRYICDESNYYIADNEEKSKDQKTWNNDTKVYKNYEVNNVNVYTMDNNGNNNDDDDGNNNNGNNNNDDIDNNYNNDSDDNDFYHENVINDTINTKINYIKNNVTSDTSICNVNIGFCSDANVNERLMKTPYQFKLKFAQIYHSYGKDCNIVDIAYNLGFVPELDIYDLKTMEKRELLEHTLRMLYSDVVNIYEYRKICDEINPNSFKKWFPDYPLELLHWLDDDRDFIYNTNGLRLLKNRYLRKNEPIQYCMLRIARLFLNIDDITNISSYKYHYWILYYHLLSCGFMQVSSILADSDNADETIIKGEACRLVVATKDYGREFIKQMESICTMISLGVGVGLDVSTVPLNGHTKNGHIHGGLFAVTKKLDSCNYLSIYERKPKIALYLSIHNDSIYEAFNLRHPAKEHVENVFFGVMINDYFMKCLRQKQVWYLFPGNAILNGKNLSDFKEDEYEIMYKRFVDAKLYTKVTTAEELMDRLLTSLCESGSPYVIWDDILNRYSNHSHLGKIKTLNLCAEITNYSSPEESSSCTLLSMNCGMFKDFSLISEALYSYLRTIDNVFDKHITSYDNVEECKFTYMLGYMGTRALNDFMGKDRKNREIGINPMGVYDMAIINNKNPINIVGEISEAMYLGCIHASCQYYKQYNVKCDRFNGSHFNAGVPQWMLRDSTTHIKWPENIYQMMRNGMANSMLTSQAPTATTSMLCGVTESVMIPLNVITTKESENGRNAFIAYGIMHFILNRGQETFLLDNEIDTQIAMYSKSAPFIDQSQSTMFSIEFNKNIKQTLFDLLKKTYFAELKTAIYYIMPKLLNPTLSIIRPTTEMHQLHYQQKSNTIVAADVSDINMQGKAFQRNTCDSCAL
ncbi:RR1 [Mauternbach virus]|uniref:RR1 n=1 Tax=Mauternbach virus TaxID=2486603 RepID=A0A3G3E5Z9_9VIRU|nr:RR1 [Mauternbach virus]AYP97896.1 RR1 [Mauternbach virus]